MTPKVSIPIMNVVRGGSLGLRGVSGGAFWYRIGVGFVGVVVQHLIVYGMDSLPLLCHNALLTVVLVEGNRAPVRRTVKDISLFMRPTCCRYSAQWKLLGIAVCSPFPDQASAHQSKQGGAGCVVLGCK